jgi:Mitochondrial carrier protein
MYTHRYVRTRLVEENERDRYDLLLNEVPTASRSSSSLETHGNNSNDSKEYWTNGRTTLLSNNCKSDISHQSWEKIRPQQQRSDHYPLVVRNVESSIMTSRASSPSTMSARASSSASSSSGSSNSHVVRNSLLAGSVAGMTSTALCHPFDVLRTKMQSSAPLVAATAPTATTTSTAAAAATVASTASSQPMGIVGTLRHTLQAGGVRALYTGLALPLAAQAVYKSTVFTVNKVTEASIVEWKTQEQYKLGNFKPYQLTVGDRFVSGCMGGAVNAALFCTPVEYVRNQQIAQIGEKQKSNGSLLRRPLGPIAVIRNTIHAHGVTGLWRGLASTVLRDSIGCGCFFAAMAQTQTFLQHHPLPWEDHPPSSDGPPSTSSLIVSGAVAGVAFWLWALPVDTCKTWIQSGTASNLTHALQMSQRRGFWQSIPSLFRGWQVAYSRGAPSAAVTVVTYSLIFQHLQQYHS